MTETKKQQNDLYGEQDEATDKEQHEEVTQKDEKKKRRRKKGKNKVRHPPEYYEELKREKENRRREEEWNNRFNLGSIPSLVEQEREVKAKTKQRLKSLKRLDSPKSKDVIYKTFNVEAPNRTKPSKSFNIRIIPKKEEEAPKKEPIDDKEKVKEKEKEKEKDEVREKQIESLIEQVRKVHGQMKFLDCHRDVLFDVIRKSKEKTLKSYIHAQIAKLKGKTSSCSTLEKAIEKRENAIKAIQQTKGPISAQNLRIYRVSTLRVIEQILKWKQQCEHLYIELTRTKPKVAFTLNNENYLLKISKGFKCEQLKQESGNPFLLGLEEGVIENELLVKIRACQMLLLENQLDTGS